MEGDLKFRTHTCYEITKKDIGKEVIISGWAQNIRDHGGIIFIDLRDYYGITQVVFKDISLTQNISKETVIKVTGIVTKRDNETINYKLYTGEVEINVKEVEILGKCESVLPFEIQESLKTKEEIRLKYRYLDLRNEKVKEKIIFRSKIISYLRKKMSELGFLEITTPILTSSSPEGARDYIIPSRKHKGKFFALPQAPQQFKQLLMVSGIDKYFQIAPCFRDEDARADRTPGEFYQLDFEMAFANQEDIFEIAENVLYDVFSKYGKKKIFDKHFEKITYEDAMRKYGTDKPDLRNPLVISDLSKFFSDVEFKPFQGKEVRGIVVHKSSKLTNSCHEKLLEYALSIGMKGLGYIEIEEDGTYKGPIGKYLSEEKKKELVSKLSLVSGDTLFFISDSKMLTDKLSGYIRRKIGEELGIIDEERYMFCFITDFPMFEKKDDGKIDFMHNPFSMPQASMEEIEKMDSLEIKAYQYDVVCNGVELSSGAVRNHKIDIMEKVFEIAGYEKSELETKFGALYTAFKYGAPPHAGMAPGIERIIMLLLGEESIREIIPFPMTTNAEDLLMEAPGYVTEKQLREVHIKLR